MQGKYRLARVGATAIVLVTLAGCGGALLPEQTDHVTGTFKNYAELRKAYDHIVPGSTRIEDLTKIGFDADEPNVEQLSYLGVMQQFLPRANMDMQDVAPEVRGCIRAREHCVAYVYKPSLVESSRTGDTMLDIFGFDRTTVDHGWSAEVTLLIQDGRVAYKVISSKPKIEATHEKISPLGPLQDLGAAVVPAAEHL